MYKQAVIKQLIRDIIELFHNLIPLLLASARDKDTRNTRTKPSARDIHTYTYNTHTQNIYTYKRPCFCQKHQYIRLKLIAKFS